MGQLDEFYHGKVCLVTGGCGFIGRALGKRLLALGAGPVAYDIKQLSTRDVRDANGLPVMFHRHQPDLVFHLAAHTEVLSSYDTPYSVFQTNTMGTLNVLECLRQRHLMHHFGACKNTVGGPNPHTAEMVKPIAGVVASTDKVYGTGTERDELNTLDAGPDPYSQSKRLADILCQDYANTYKMRLHVLRCCNIYGPGQTNLTTLIAGTCARLLHGQPAVLHQFRGDVLREWLHIDDAVEAYLLAGMSAYQGDCLGDLDTYRCPADRGVCAMNVGSGRAMSAFDTVRLIRAYLRHEHSLVVCPIAEPKEARPQIEDQSLDSTRFHNQFPHWKARGFLEGLKQTVAWYVDEHKAGRLPPRPVWEK